VLLERGVDVNVHLLEDVQRDLDVVLEREGQRPLGWRLVRDGAVDVVEGRADEIAPYFGTGLVLYRGFGGRGLTYCT
jgi:hypothetical protein